MDTTRLAPLVVVAYLVGSVPTGVLIARLRGLPDPRGEGSGNIGATNVARSFGAKLGALTLLGDVLKGVLPVMV
ncbi:MAG: glycerol-3-phosphate acyltransferase, partial [Planctomycetes bacterium]|nr:glycerol-3-phosphate acyltransferase [Planctomycetota bacterium]